MTGELLLELLSEEIPARMQRRAIEELSTHLDEWLQVHRIRAATITGYVTPRRLTLIAEGVPARQPDHHDEKRGPRIGSPEQAIAGFLRSVGLTSIDQCEVRDDRFFAVVQQKGREATDVLPDVIEATMNSLTWPKSMRYPASPLRWVRPLNSVVCLFDGEVLGLPLGDVPVGRVTRGHRFLSPGEITVADAADYREKLAKAHVVLDRAERRAMIAAGLDKLAVAAGLRVKPDEALLDEVTGLVECPVVLMGSIDADFVRPLPDGLPPEVLATAMRTHQKYFSCLNPDGTPAPRFLFVANNVTPDNGKTIAAGNERVLRARLSDARFFWDQDRKIRLEDRVEALKQRVYHEKLGSVYDKVERMEKLAGFLANQLAPQFVTPAQAGVQGDRSSPALDSRLRGNDDGEDFEARCCRAARLAKADLSSGMVGEFPELQGIMGRYYALYDGEEPRVADAIADHYKPLGPNDTCPSRPESIVVALADKIDALFAFFWVNERPTGSRDPFALRRAALGVIRIILENERRVSLEAVFAASHKIFVADQFLSTLLTGNKRYLGAGPFVSDVGKELLDFIAERLKVDLRGDGFRHDLIAAIFALKEDDPVRLLARVAALQTFLRTDDGASLLIAYRRASNIVDIEERHDGKRYDYDPNEDLFREAEERTLSDRLKKVGIRVDEELAREFFESAMIALTRLRQPVDEFFERVTVNVDDKNLRENRLRLLARIRATMNQIADFSQIEG